MAISLLTIIGKVHFDIGLVRKSKIHHALTYHEICYFRLHMMGDFIPNPCIIHADVVTNDVIILRKALLMHVSLAFPIGSFEKLCCPFNEALTAKSG